MIEGGVVPGPVQCQHEWAIPLPSVDIMDCDLMLGDPVRKDSITAQFNWNEDPFNDIAPNDYLPIE